MASNYPGALDTLATNKTDVTPMGFDHPQHHDDMADAINKIEAELGINPSGSISDVVTRLNVTQNTDGTLKGSAAQLNLNPTAVKAANYTAVAYDLVPVDTTSGAITITLPTAPTDLTRIGVKLVTQGGTNTVTINSGGSDVFNKTGGGTSLTLKLLNQAVVLQYKATGAIWYIISDDLSLAQLDARYISSAGSQTDPAKLIKWYDKFATDPANAKILFLGDSTSYEPGVLNFYTRFRPAITATVGSHTLPTGTITLVSTAGFPQAGVANVGGQSVTYTSVNTTQLLGASGGSGVISAGSTVVSAATPNQVHTAINGPLAGMTQDATHIIAGGNNGVSLATWIVSGGGTYLLSNLTTDQPDLIVFSFGLNDVRTHTDTFTWQQLRDLIITAITLIRNAAPNASIILRIPNGATTDNVAAQNFVTNNAGSINPVGAAQAMTDTLRLAYLALADKWDNVVVWDAQTRIFGHKAIASTQTNLFANQIHPSATGYQAIVDTLVADLIGLPLNYGPRLGDGIISTSITPWTIDAGSLDDPLHFQLIYSGEYNSQAATTLMMGNTGNRIDDPFGYPLDVQLKDIVRLPDDVCYVLSGVSIVAQASGVAIPNLLLTGQSIPANTVTAGRVRIYREIDQGDQLFAKLRSSTAVNRFVRLGRIANGSTTFVIINAEPLVGSRVPSGQWGVTKSDSLVISGNSATSIALTNYTFALSGEHLQINGSGFDFTPYIGRLILVTGSHGSEIVASSFITGLVTKAAAYTLVHGDNVVLADATSAVFTLTLPTAVGRPGQQFTIKRINAGTNDVIVGTTSSQTIDGSTTWVLNSQYESVTVISDGANWMVIA